MLLSFSPVGEGWGSGVADVRDVWTGLFEEVQGIGGGGLRG